MRQDQEVKEFQGRKQTLSNLYGNETEIECKLFEDVLERYFSEDFEKKFLYIQYKISTSQIWMEILFRLPNTKTK